MSFGRTVINTAGRDFGITADGSPEWKLGGVTINWDAVTAVSGSDETLADGTIVRVGDKYLRYGTVLWLDSSSGDYEPAGPSDTLTRGETVILNNTVVQDRDGVNQAEHVGAIEGGRVFINRVDTDGSFSPTLTNLLAAMPRLMPVTE